MSTPVLVDPDERIVEEVLCSECGVPIPAIPQWYAKVAVRFTCDSCRQKSPKLTPALPVLDSETTRVSAVDADADPDADPAIDDIDIDDVDVDEADADSDADPVEE